MQAELLLLYSLKSIQKMTESSQNSNSPAKTITLRDKVGIQPNYPVRLLIQNIKSGELSGVEEISADGKNWVRIDQHPQLTEYFQIPLLDIEEDKNRLTRLTDKLKTFSIDLSQKTKNKYDDISLLYEESRVKKVIDKVKDRTTENIDIISGTKILDEVRIRLDKQDQYNDLLATKLAEALEEISTLKKKIESIGDSK